MSAGPLRRAAPALLLLLLAGCLGGGPAPLPVDRTSVYFPAGGVVDTIEIDTLDRLPLRSVELVAPDGTISPARAIAARPASRETSFAAPSPVVVGATLQTSTELLATVSNATLPLPDPIAYRRNWQKYRIRLRFGDPPRADSREIAAPRPPPAAPSPLPSPAAE